VRAAQSGVASGVADGPIVAAGLLDGEATAVAEAVAVAVGEPTVGVAMDVVAHDAAITATIRQAGSANRARSRRRAGWTMATG
jgi:hypothetical protein